MHFPKHLDTLMNYIKLVSSSIEGIAFSFAVTTEHYHNSDNLWHVTPLPTHRGRINVDAFDLNQISAKFPQCHHSKYTYHHIALILFDPVKSDCAWFCIIRAIYMYNMKQAI